MTEATGKWYIIILLSCWVSFSWGQGITLMGYIKNGFTHKAVPDVTVTLMREDGSIISDSVMAFPLDNGTVWVKQQFPRQQQKVVVRVTHPEYETAWLTYEVKHFGRNTQINFPDILLERKAHREVALDEVVVRPTKIKMVMRGDTIVYDATAFNLPEGSMLSDLISQLPGAELKPNGEIFINGKKIDYLMLNSREFFKGNNQVMLRNLPYYTVQDVKVYHRTTDLSAYLNRDVDKKEYVMDVRLKRDYNMGYLGNIDGGLGTRDTWAARTFGLRFSDRSRLSLYGNLNNVNDMQRPYNGGDWGGQISRQGVVETKQAGGEWLFYTPDDKFRNSLQANVRWTDRNDESRISSQKFLADGSNTFSHSQSLSLDKLTDLDILNWFNVTKKWWVRGEVGFSYRKNRRESATSLTSSDTDILMSDTLTYRNDEQYNEGNEKQLEAELDLTRKLAWGDEISLSADYKHQSSEHEMFGCNNTFTPLISDYRHEYDKARRRDHTVSAKINYTIPFINGPALSFRYSPKYAVTANRDNMYRLDWLEGWESATRQQLRILPSSSEMLAQAIDADNSFDYENAVTSHLLSVGLMWQKYKQDDMSRRLELNIPVTLSAERMTYQRGQLDTLCHRDYVILAPSFNYESTWHENRNRFTVSSSWQNRPADYLQTLMWKDSRNPLALSEGNPDLKQSWTYNASTSLSFRIPAHQQMISVSASANVYGNLVTNGFTYSPESGVYTYRPENINGNWDTNVSSAYSVLFGEEQRFKFENSAQMSYWHSVDMAATDMVTTERLSKVNTTLFNEKVMLSYNQDNFFMSVTGSVGLRHTAATTTLNTKDYIFGCSSRYTISVLRTTVSADGNLYSRRGYGSAEFNTDEFVLNASLSQPFLKNKLIVRIEAFDILHQLSSTRYEVNAQGRTETWYRSLPNYVMFHLVYHWNRNPKKQK